MEKVRASWDRDPGFPWVQLGLPSRLEARCRMHCWGLGFRDKGLVFRNKGLGFRIKGLGL